MVKIRPPLLACPYSAPLHVYHSRLIPITATYLTLRPLAAKAREFDKLTDKMTFLPY